jgi:hypothetical protein
MSSDLNPANPERSPKSLQVRSQNQFGILFLRVKALLVLSLTPMFLGTSGIFLREDKDAPFVSRREKRSRFFSHLLTVVHV